VPVDRTAAYRPKIALRRQVTFLAMKYDTIMWQSIDKSLAVAQMGDRLATINMGRKVVVLCPSRGGAESPSNTSPGPRPISVPSGILVRPTV